MNKPKPKIYPTTHWSSYDRALINWGNITIWFAPAKHCCAPDKGKQEEVKKFIILSKPFLFLLSHLSVLHKRVIIKL